MKEAAAKADELIANEIARQDRMWGEANERADSSKRQLMHAAMAQLDLLDLKHMGENSESAVEIVKEMTYPQDWGGFRDYGSDVANLVVASAYLRQEIKRLIANGESTHRASRNPETQPYQGSDQPAVIEP